MIGIHAWFEWLLILYQRSAFFHIILQNYTKNVEKKLKNPKIWKIEEEKETKKPKIATNLITHLPPRWPRPKHGDITLSWPKKLADSKLCARYITSDITNGLFFIKQKILLLLTHPSTNECMLLSTIHAIYKGWGFSNQKLNSYFIIFTSMPWNYQSHSVYYLVHLCTLEIFDRHSHIGIGGTGNYQRIAKITACTATLPYSTWPLQGSTIPVLFLRLLSLVHSCPVILYAIF